MITGSQVKLSMCKILKKGMSMDKKEYTCTVDLYDIEAEKMHLQISEDDLNYIYLDAKYTCKIYTEDQVLSCEGIIKERYQGVEGSMVIFYIENGFYDITEMLKCEL